MVRGELRVRFADHFRQRRSEWLLAFAMAAIGLAYLTIANLFSSAYFTTMVAIMPQQSWGVVVFTCALTRLEMLRRNGSLRISPYFRAAGAVLGAWLWLSLFIAAITSDRLVQSTFLWLLFFVFDCFAAYDATGDARLSYDLGKPSRTGSADVRPA